MKKLMGNNIIKKLLFVFVLLGLTCFWGCAKTLSDDIFRFEVRSLNITVGDSFEIGMVLGGVDENTKIVFETAFETVDEEGNAVITSGSEYLNVKGNETTNIDTTQSVANTILAKEALSQKEGTYYVYFYDYTDEVSSVSTSVNSISDKVYKVNTKDGFNSNYVSEETNKDASSIEDLKVKALTLIKVVDGEIVEYYEGREEINNNFGE